jgi:hypothetical protein
MSRRLSPVMVRTALRAGGCYPGTLPTALCLLPNIVYFLRVPRMLL